MLGICGTWAVPGLIAIHRRQLRDSCLGPGVRFVGGFGTGFNSFECCMNEWTNCIRQSELVVKRDDPVQGLFVNISVSLLLAEGSERHTGETGYPIAGQNSREIQL